MAKLKIACPACGTTLTVDEVHLGKTGRCKQCGAKFRISRPEAPPADVTPPATPRPPAQPKAKATDATQPAKSATGRHQAAMTQPTVPASNGEQGPPEATIRHDEPAKPEDMKAADDAVPAEWNVGDVILDTYEVKQVHTGGGMGLVYRVHHRNWNMDLAVKSPRPEYFATEQQKADFIRECETWINLGLHPNIVSCYYVRTLGGIPRVFAEYVEGGSLKDWIDSRKLYEGGPDEALKRILDIAIQTAWGLHYAHDHEDENKRKRELVHQDFKPANVMMTPDGEAKVTDFGLARARARAGESAADAPACGQQSILVSFGGMTPAYCSPEQANGEKLTRATDIWSWGLSVLEMFTGGVTWLAGQAAPEALEAYLAVGPEDESIPKMPLAISQFLQQCFQRSSDERPTDMAKATEKLRTIYLGETHKDYMREEPSVADLQADTLNNQAASMEDLKRSAEAERLYDQALRSDPTHPEATYNKGLLLWRSARIADDELLRLLHQVCKSHEGHWRAQHLLGLAHIERGDMEGAAQCLVEAQAKVSGHVLVPEATQKALANPKGTGVLRHTLGDQTHPLVMGCFSPDGHHILAAGNSKTYSLWDSLKGRRLADSSEHEYRITSFCFASPGGLILSACEDGAIRVSDADACNTLRAFRGRQHINSLCCSPDGATAASGSGYYPGGKDNVVQVWQLATGALLDELHGHKDMVTCVRFHPTKKCVLSASRDGTVVLWQLSTGQAEQVLKHVVPVASACFDRDGTWLLSGAEDGRLRLWDVETGSCVRELEGHLETVCAVDFSPDGSYVLSASRDSTFRLWQVSTGRCIRTFDMHTNWVNSVCFSPDGRHMLSASNDGCLRIWELGLRTVHRAPSALCRAPTATDAAANQRRFESCVNAAKEAMARDQMVTAMQAVREARSVSGFSRSVAALDLWARLAANTERTALSDAWCVRVLDCASPVASVSVGGDGHWLASGTWDHRVRLWDIASGECIRVLDGARHAVLSVSSALDGHLVLGGCGSPLTGREASGEKDNSVRIWEASTGACLQVLTGHSDPVESVAFSPDGRWGASGSRDGSLRLWSISSGLCVWVSRFGATWGHMEQPQAVAFSPDGRCIASGHWDGTVRLWDVARRQCACVLHGHSGVVRSVCFTPDCKFVLSGGNDSCVRLWEIATGQCMRVFEGHSTLVNAVCSSPDGRWIASGSGSELSKEDKSIRLWELSTGKCSRVLEGHIGPVCCVGFSREGRWLVSGSQDGTIRIWALDWALKIPDSVNWDERARPCLQTFLTLHCPYGDDGINRVGKPTWGDEDFKRLLEDVQCGGYGWVRSEVVRKKLEEMTANWQGPPPLPWEK